MTDPAFGAQLDVVEEFSSDEEPEEEPSTSTNDSGNSIRNSGIIFRPAGTQPGLGGRIGSKAGRTLKPPEPEMRITATPEDQNVINEQLRKSERTCDANLGKLGFVVNVEIHLWSLAQNCQNLRVVDLSENGISWFPPDFFVNLQRLETVKLTHNRLQELPPSLLQLPLLRVLLLDNNQLSYLHPLNQAQFINLPSLTDLGLEWNLLLEFPAAFLCNSPCLQRLYISENTNLLDLPDPGFFAGRRFPITIKLDNRPPLLMRAAAGFPGVDFQWNKIYPDKVLDYVYLGSIRTAQSPEVYKDLDIGHILTAGRNLDVVLTPTVDQLEINIDDVHAEDITPFFDECFKYINHAIQERRGVLLHCFAGLSRSVTIMIAYLMAFQYPMTFEDALAFVREARPASSPNDGFIHRLKQWENLLRANGGYRPGLSL